MILCDGDGWSGDVMFVWLPTDFPTKRVHPIPYTKWVNYTTDSLLEARDPKTFSLHPTHLPTNQLPRAEQKKKSDKLKITAPERFVLHVWQAEQISPFWGAG